MNDWYFLVWVGMRGNFEAALSRVTVAYLRNGAQCTCQSAVEQNVTVRESVKRAVGESQRHISIHVSDTRYTKETETRNVENGPSETERHVNCTVVKNRLRADVRFDHKQDRMNTQLTSVVQ